MAVMASDSMAVMASEWPRNVASDALIEALIKTPIQAPIPKRADSDDLRHGFDTLVPTHWRAWP